MTDLQKLILCREAMERVGMMLDDPTETRVKRCQQILSEALAKTMVPVFPERLRFPHINEEDFVKIFKS